MTKQSDPLIGLLEQARHDPALRAALKADPARVMAEAGIEVNEDATYEVVEPTPDEIQVVLRSEEAAEADELGVETLEPRATKTTLLCVPGPGGMVTLMPVCIVG